LNHTQICTSSIEIQIKVLASYCRGDQVFNAIGGISWGRSILAPLNFGPKSSGHFASRGQVKLRVCLQQSSGSIADKIRVVNSRRREFRIWNGLQLVPCPGEGLYLERHRKKSIEDLNSVDFPPIQEKLKKSDHTANEVSGW
jgi:hypothetical protein